MKKAVNIHEAKTHQSRRQPLLGTPEARKPGRLKGHFRIADDFDASLPEGLLKSFEGNADFNKRDK
jgi:hypothetical protein